MSMSSVKRGLGMGCLAMGALLGSVSSWAQSGPGGITYAPVESQGIPTLSEWGLLATALLLAVLAYRLLRGRLGGRPLASVVLAGALGLALAGGGLQLQSAQAQSEVEIALSLPGGGQAMIPDDGVWLVRNTSGVAQSIVALSAADGFNFESYEGSPRCEVAMVLAPGATCYINLVNNNLD